MASLAKRTSLIRKRKETRQGTRRKAKLRTEGSTKSKAELFGDEEK